MLPALDSSRAEILGRERQVTAWRSYLIFDFKQPNDLVVTSSPDRRWIASSLSLLAKTESKRPLQRRHHRACPGDPRPGFVTARKTWMAGTSARSTASSPRPAMTMADSRVNCLTATPPRSRRMRASFGCRFAHPKHQRAQGMPGARCARSLACKNKKAYEHSHHGHTGLTRHSPRNGFNGFLRTLPGDRAFLSPSSAGHYLPT
jgi:hypothetical protein